MRKYRIIALLTLTAFLMAMLPAAAFAAGGPPQFKGTVILKLEFKDSHTAGWAAKAISELKVKGVIAGYPDGSVQPNKPVTRAEALAMVLKSAGLAEEVQQKVSTSVYGSVYLPFKDAPTVPQWVRGFVELAAEKGYLPEERAANFQPNKPATRLWVARLLVRVMQLTVEANSLNNIELPFKDAATVPSDGVAFIAAAVQNGLLQGYPDGTCRPNKPVTRAEMAALLSKSDDEVFLPKVKLGKIEGTVVRVEVYSATVSDNVYGSVYTPAVSSITVKKEDGAEATYPVSSDARIYIQDNAAALADITAGMRVELVLNRDGMVIYIESKAETYRGKLTVVDSVYRSLTLQTEEQEKTFTVAENAVITLNGAPAALADLAPGMKAGIKISDGKVAEIKAFSFKKKPKEKKR